MTSRPGQLRRMEVRQKRGDQRSPCIVAKWHFRKVWGNDVFGWNPGNNEQQIDELARFPCAFIVLGMIR